ncbi:MAG: hypothetical protein ACJ8GO_11465 [Ramlibacter sp.]
MTVPSMRLALCILASAMAAVLAGCSGMATVADPGSACAAGEASYACQVERYRNANM